MELLTIGQMAELNHISKQTLRLYDRMGLISPNTRGENGYRYYDIKQSAILDIIQYLKGLGLSLKEIKLQFDKRDLGAVEAMLKEKYRQSQEEIHHLKFQQRALERTIENISRYRSAPPAGTLQMEYIGQREMYIMDIGVNVYEHDSSLYESVLREIQDKFIKEHVPQIYFYNIGTFINKEDFLQEKLCSNKVFAFVDQDFVPAIPVQTIPAGNYACIYCDDFAKEKEYTKLLLQYIKKSKCEVCGDYLCESIVDIPVPSGDVRGLHLRLQVPVIYK